MATTKPENSDNLCPFLTRNMNSFFRFFCQSFFSNWPPTNRGSAGGGKEKLDAATFESASAKDIISGYLVERHIEWIRSLACLTNRFVKRENKQITQELTQRPKGGGCSTERKKKKFPNKFISLSPVCIFRSPALNDQHHTLGLFSSLVRSFGFFFFFLFSGEEEDVSYGRHLAQKRLWPCLEGGRYLLKKKGTIL